MTTAMTNASTTQAIETSSPVIRCVGLSKTFKDFWLRNRVRAVDNISLEVNRGELFGLLGPNGSGKSTTIKMILGLLHSTTGRISVMGKRPDDVSVKRMIGYLPEESYLYRFLNARETLDYYARLFFQNRLQRRRRVDMLLEMVGLDAVQRRPVGEYSKGMQRRIGLAQALINDPHLLILDEPTTGLDPIGTRQIKDLLLEMKSRGKTILLCSHLLSDVEDVCDRVAIMYGGKVRQEGTVDQLLTQTDSTTLELPQIDAQTLEEIKQVLARRGLDITRIDHPRQKLEALFLEIVQQAQAEGVATSGASAGGRIAEFLSSELDPASVKAPQQQQVLDDLVKDEPVQEAPQTPIAQSQDAQPKVSSSVLDALTQPEVESTPVESQPQQDVSSSSIPEKKKPVAGDQSVLDGLLGSDEA